MNRLGYIVLSILSKNNAVSVLTAMTIKEIAGMEDFGCQENTIYKKIREFQKSGYVKAGAKEGRASTFYITSAGNEEINKIRSEKRE